ncbi:hypothetical protein BaRGS_00028416 [Batillaria attramentaria]|uniref:Uncharacterized protein n=1 Tax=Batillaria attramentaria TaxID=370345 RepID=A0ABD0JZW9_9CAEN
MMTCEQYYKEEFESVYDDNVDRDTVFGSWVRVVRPRHSLWILGACRQVRSRLPCKMMTCEQYYKEEFESVYDDNVDRDTVFGSWVCVVRSEAGHHA